MRWNDGFGLCGMHIRDTMSRGGYVYILTNRKDGTLYIGVTSRPLDRIAEHRSGKGSRFAHRYNLHRLVYLERHERVIDAIAREKAMKVWRRAWKIELIESVNPDWRDLWPELAHLARE